MAQACCCERFCCDNPPSILLFRFNSTGGPVTLTDCGGDIVAVTPNLDCSQRWLINTGTPPADVPADCPNVAPGLPYVNFNFLCCRLSLGYYIANVTAYDTPDSEIVEIHMDTVQCSPFYIIGTSGPAGVFGSLTLEIYEPGFSPP